MSWLRDENEDLVNLDEVGKIEVAELEEEAQDEEKTHCVVARFQIGDDRVVFTGTEIECNARRDAISSKLPMLRF